MTPILQLHNIEFITKDRVTPILYKLNFNVFPEEFIIILGHNGSGKSSLLKILSGDITPTYGKILLNGLNFNKLTANQRSKNIVTLTQSADDRLFLDLSLEENILLWESRFPYSKRLSYKQIFKSNFGVKFLDMLKKPIYTFSGGEKQALLLMLTLSHPPQILFLDEHTSSLDYKIANEIMYITNQTIIDNKITSIMVTHNLEDALNYGNRIIILNKGRVVFDKKKNHPISIEELKNLME